MDKDIEKCTILEVNKGLRQRSGFSPILFDLYMNKGLEISRTYSPKGIKLTKNTEINTILFADDQILLALNKDDLQRAVTTLNKVIKTYNMKISCNKTKSMAMMGREQKRVKIVVDGEDIEQVQTLNIWAVRYLQ
jgi:uncharacterized lipoprotein YehR (DUF1307 family)